MNPRMIRWDRVPPGQSSFYYLYYLYYLYSGALLFVADAAVHAHVYSSHLTQGIKISAVWDRSDLLLMGLGQVRGTEKARW